ncbi:hypothetical protein NL676_021619 [Syzygium grande]|nr:hypothetical protein NL676_021619 [Syzygium grande]
MHTHFAKRSNELTHDKPEGKRPTPTSLPPRSKPKSLNNREQHQIRQNKRGNDAPISFAAVFSSKGTIFSFDLPGKKAAIRDSEQPRWLARS